MSKRIQFSRTGGPEVLEYADDAPGSPGPGEVRVRHRAIGVNYLDIYLRSGLYPVAALPSGIGSEGAGIVEAVGPGVTHLSVGDRVAYASGPPGAYSEARVISAALVVRLPDAIDFEPAAALLLKGLTVQYLFRRTHHLKGGETILFHAAAGGVGLIACQWARALGVRLIGTVSSPEKAAIARRHGAWQTIDYSREDVPRRVLELTDGAKCPVVYDAVGKDTWEMSLDCLQPFGLLVSFGNSSGPVTGVNLGILAQKGSLYVTRPSLPAHMTPREKLEQSCHELFGLVTSGQIAVDVERRFPLREAAAAHTALADRKTTGSTILLP